MLLLFCLLSLICSTILIIFLFLLVMMLQVSPWEDFSVYFKEQRSLSWGFQPPLLSCLLITHPSLAL